MEKPDCRTWLKKLAAPHWKTTTTEFNGCVSPPISTLRTCKEAPYLGHTCTMSFTSQPRGRALPLRRRTVAWRASPRSLSVEFRDSPACTNKHTEKKNFLEIFATFGKKTWNSCPTYHHFGNLRKGVWNRDVWSNVFLSNVPSCKSLEEAPALRAPMPSKGWRSSWQRLEIFFGGRQKKMATFIGWWFQPIWKILVKWEIFPKKGWK